MRCQITGGPPEACGGAAATGLITVTWLCSAPLPIPWAGLIATRTLGRVQLFATTVSSLRRGGFRVHMPPVLGFWPCISAEMAGCGASGARKIWCRAACRPKSAWRLMLGQ